MSYYRAEMILFRILFCRLVMVLMCLVLSVFSTMPETEETATFVLYYTVSQGYPRTHWTAGYVVRVTAFLTSGSHLVFSYDCNIARRGYILTFLQGKQQLSIVDHRSWSIRAWSHSQSLIEQTNTTCPVHQSLSLWHTSQYLSYIAESVSYFLFHRW